VDVPLITFEGIDGCGKSTQIEMLKKYFESQNVRYSIFREPGGSDIGEKIRAILLDKSNAKMDSKTEFLLFAASRAQLVHEKIMPQLKTGEFVLLDRYIDSSVAYQGFGRGLGKKIITVINEFATEMLYPDLTFYLEIDEETFAKRKGFEKDRMESEDIDFIKRVIEGYNYLSDSKRFVKIDARADQSLIFQDVVREIKNKFNL
jgi:dTMP kinase